MVLPLYLAMTGAEMCTIPHPAYLMADWSDRPPAGFLPVITDRQPLTEQAVDELCRMAEDWDVALLDFENPATPEARRLLERLPCPAAAPPGYSDTGPVFLPPAPLHVPLEACLSPWQGREVWLEAALQKQVITVTEAGARFSAPSPAGNLSGGFHDEILHCRFTQEFFPDRAVFTLFDTPETLKEKLDHAAAFGVTRAVGLYQELGNL